jgi:hypothetical protein
MFVVFQHPFEVEHNKLDQISPVPRGDWLRGIRRAHFLTGNVVEKDSIAAVEMGISLKSVVA